MVPGVHPITLVRGDDWGMAVIPSDEAQNPIDLTGWTARAHIRKKPNDSAPLAVMDTNIDLAQSQIVLTVAGAVTAPFKITSGVWDLELTTPEGVIQTVLAGPVTIILDATH